MNQFEKLKIKNKYIYPVNDVALGYRYWCRTLTEKCIGMTKITGLEEQPNIPVKQVQMDLVLFGQCGIFKHPKYGLCEVHGTPGGAPDMFYHPTLYTYANPVLGSGALKIGHVGNPDMTSDKYCAVIYNQYTDVPDAGGLINPQGLWPTIKRNAAMLADIESSITVLAVNRRATAFPAASTEPLAKSVEAAWQFLRAGEFKAITSGSILDTVESIPFDNGSRDSLTELYELKRSVLKSFLEEIGIKTIYEKKERMNVDEVGAGNQLLVVNLDDMISCQQEGWDVANKLFGLDVHVSIDEDYDPRLVDEQMIEEDEEEEVKIYE